MTALAPTKLRNVSEQDAKRSRVVATAIWWVNDQACSEALADLEDAVADLIGHAPAGTAMIDAALSEGTTHE